MSQTPPWYRQVFYRMVALSGLKPNSYGGFGALAWIVFASKSLIWPVFMVAIIGFMDETMQYFTPGRSADVLDLVADISGAVLAVLLLRLFQRLFFRATRA